MKTLAILLMASGLALAGSAAAQSQENITLRVNSGSVMVSSGGEFVSAQSGQAVSQGQRMSVSADSHAQVVYDRGTTDTRDDCVIEFKQAGVYEVPGDCKPAGAWQAGNDGVSRWILIGTAVAAGAMINSGDDVPVSQGALNGLR